MPFTLRRELKPLSLKKLPLLWVKTVSVVNWHLCPLQTTKQNNMLEKNVSQGPVSTSDILC